MEAVGFSASILTFVGAAITISKSVHDTLSAIKDGPEIIGFLSDEISQLETILQKLSEVFALTATPVDRPELEELIKKCKDDLFRFQGKLRQLNVSGAVGRRGRLWRKIKFSYEEKTLDQIRHVVRGHVSAFTLHMVIIQARQQAPLRNILPTPHQINPPDILPTLQQIKQDMEAIKVSQTSATIMQHHSTGMSSRATELADTRSHFSQQHALDDTITRLMKLLEKRPCVVESEGSKEIVDDLERLLKFVQDEVLSEKRGAGDDEDVSQELKLFTGLVTTAPSIRINQNGPLSSFEATESQLAVFQERKQRDIRTNDALLTVRTTKQRGMLLLPSQDASANELYGRAFRGSLVLKSKSKKKMVTLFVQQGQLLFDRFTSLLPRVIVCNILPNDSLVFEVASNGSVEDLMRLIIGNKASLDDHDEDGWSLLHHAVGNLATFKFLIEQGLDVTEIAEDKSRFSDRKTDPLTIANDYYYDYDIEFSELLLHSGADPTIKLKGQPILVKSRTYEGNNKARKFLHRTASISPFVFPATPADGSDLLYGFCQGWVSVPGEDFNPGQERKTLDLLISHGYNVQPSNQSGNGLHGFFSSRKRSFSKVVERRDLLTFLISKGADLRGLDLAGFAPSYKAYRKMCKPCSMSHSSLMGDLYDNLLSIHGYDISAVRHNYPRVASYKNGYTREIFEQLWSGREERCPYWNDEPWPKFSCQDARLDFESELAQGMCTYCQSCFDSFSSCHRCGVCLLVFRYSCYEKSNPDHEHNYECPRTRVGYLERYENCDHLYFRAKIDSDLDSNDETSDYPDSSVSGDDSGSEISDSYERVTEYYNGEIEELSSDDDSPGEAEL